PNCLLLPYRPHHDLHYFPTRRSSDLAGAENLTRTSAAVMLAIEQARKEERKLICFITGVPGSGKTLAGLNIVHSRELHEGSLGVDRKSTRLNSSHGSISYAVFCLKKK